MVSMLVIPDLIGEFTEADWRQAAHDVVADDATSRPGDRWQVDVAVLPGHDGRPQPVGGEYDLVTPGYAVAASLIADPDSGRAWDIVVGVGRSGWTASVTVFGGHSHGLVLVDGLGDPWLTAAERADRRRARMRSIEADPTALAPHPGGGRDPRLSHGIDPLGSQQLAIRIGAATHVPTMIITTGDRSPDPDVLAAYPNASDHRTASTDPDELLPLITEWWASSRQHGN